VLNKKIVRKGIPNDLHSLYQIEKDVFDNEHWTENMISDELVDVFGRATWVLEEPHKILGYCMTRSFGKEVNIMNMAIETPSQGKGMGRFLLRYVLDQTPINSSVFLEVKQGNFNAINLYRSFGFQKINLRGNYYKDGSSALVMYLEH
tara:strand:- start:51 stop:494 length:444 start_codon:yes stop_codon:yes gene_type:complete